MRRDLNIDKVFNLLNSTFSMIKTGSKDLDEFLGGYEKGKSYLVYGEASTGKTTLAILAAVEQAKNKKVFFIDTENGFSVERVKQITDENVLDNIFVLKARDFDEQEDRINEVIKIVEKLNIDVLIIDTIGIHYRKRVREGNYKLVNSRLKKMMEKLNEVKKYGIVVLITNQVYHDFEGNIKFVGGNLINTDYKIKLIKDKERVLEIGEKSFEFEIYDKGVRKIV